MSATIYDIALKTGISKSTVSRALNDETLVKDTTRELVLKAAKELKYDPLKNIPHIKRVKTKTLAIVLPHTGGGEIGTFYAEAISYFKTFCIKANYKCVIYNENELIQFIEKRYHLGRDNIQCEGLIFFCPINFKDNYLQVIKDWDIPMTLIRRTTEINGIPCVINDDNKAVKHALNHLYTLGHKVIAVLGEDILTHPIEKPRLEAYHEFCAENNLVQDQKLVFSFSWDEDPKFEQWLPGLLQSSEKPTAFLCLNSNLSIGLYISLLEMGKKIPEDMAIIRFADTKPKNNEIPKITSECLPLESMINTAGDILLNFNDHYKNNNVIMNIGSELVIKKSSVKNRD